MSNTLIDAPTTSSQPDQPSAAYRRYALGLLTLVYITSFVDRQILAVLLEDIKGAFDVSDTFLGFLSGFAFALFYATLGIPIAMLADRGNRRNIISIALALFSVMTALCGMAQTFTHLLIARIGVGVGEAGTSPPSHSIIADLYEPKDRATAMGTFAIGVNVGIMVGFFAGGWINELYGWRAAFMAVGIPGLVIATVVRLTLKEPVRGASEGRALVTPVEKPSVLAAAKIFWKIRTMRHIAFGAALNAFVGYASITWIPSFLSRSYDMSSGDIGTYLSLIIGIGGGIGTFLGGYFADVLGKRNVRWNLWLPASLILFAVPFCLNVFLAETSTASLAWYVIPAMLGTVYLGPSLALTQSLVPLHMRTVASAILLFIINILGMGLGPQSVGITSDLLADRFGDESMRYALFLSVFIYLWSAFHFYMASRTLKEDLARVSDSA